jgi:hypothetical protein
VRYYDPGNTLVPLDSASWFVTDDLVPQLMLVSGARPTTYDRPDAVQVTYWAGYPEDGSPADVVANVPAEAKDAILIGLQLLHDGLDAATRERLENARDAMLSDMKVYGAV